LIQTPPQLIPTWSKVMIKGLIMLLVDTMSKREQREMEARNEDMMREDDPGDDELSANQFILETKQSVPLHSFVDYKQPYIVKCPPPKYMGKEILLKEMPVRK
jgi:hypothetical protein